MICWQRARELDKLVFGMTKQPEINRDYELINQWRRASGSVMDNIAEGFERGGNKEFANFLSIAKGSAGEVRSQAYRAFDRTYISQADFDIVYARCIEVSNLVQRLMHYVRQSDLKGSKYKVGEPTNSYGFDDNSVENNSHEG